LRHHRLRRCAARPAALTGWALLAGMPTSAVAAVWWPAQAGHQRRTGERTRFALTRPTYRSQISELALCSFFSSAARGRVPFGAERFFVRGRAPKMTAGTYNKYREAQLAAAVLEIKEPQLNSQRGRSGKWQGTAEQRLCRCPHSKRAVGGSSHAADWDWDSG